MITMTKKQFNSEHCIQALVLSFSAIADYKNTTDSDNGKVKYNKTNPFPPPEAAQKKMLNMTKRTHSRAASRAVDHFVQVQSLRALMKSGCGNLALNY